MHYPPPPPIPNSIPPGPVSPELAVLQQQQVNWASKRNATLQPNAPLPPPPPPVRALVPNCPPPARQPAAPPVAKKRINSRSKGQRGEREVVDLLQVVVDRVRAKLCLDPVVIQRNALQSHLGGADLHGLDGFAVEVKFVEQLAVNQWWAQTLRQADKLKAIPVLFYRASRQAWTCKVRVPVAAPDSLVEMAVTITVEEFLQWFELTYAFACLR